MIEGILNRATLGLLGLSLLLLLLALFGFFSRTHQELTYENQIVNIPPPKNSFQQPPEAYKSIGNPTFAITLAPLRVELPKLADQLIYFGKNNRPDVASADSIIQVGLKQFNPTGNITSIEFEKPLYLTYQETTGPYTKEGHFEFSPNNKETSLWVVFEPDSDSQVKGQTFLRDEQQKIITTPQENHTFTLPEQQTARYNSRGWEIGNNRADSALLARQKGRWFGQDKFLDLHGGDSYSFAHGKEKIDIGENDSTYTLYMKEGDYVVWQNEKWITPKKGENTQSLPLLQLVKVEPRVLKFELWGPDAKAKVAVNLPRSRSLLPTRGLTTEFKLIGARTHKQAIVEISKKRTILKQDDWLILTDKEGWKKITTVQELDDYVSQTNKGMLMVIDAMEKREGDFIVKGHIFTPSRSEAKYFELTTAKNEMIFLDDSPEDNLPILPGNLVPPPPTKSPETPLIQRIEETPNIDRVPRTNNPEINQPKQDDTNDEDE